MNSVGYFSFFGSVIAMAVLVLSLTATGCTGEPDVAGKPKTDPSRTETNKSVQNSASLDSLWEVRLVNVPDSIRFGVYCKESHHPLTVRLREDETFRLRFEKTYVLSHGDTTHAVATWKTKWTRNGNLFFLLWDGEPVRAKGFPRTDSADVGLRFLPVLDSLALEEAVSHMRDAVHALDTSFVVVSHYDLNPDRKAVFLLPAIGLNSEIPELPQPTETSYFSYNSEDRSRYFHKPLVESCKHAEDEL